MPPPTPTDADLDHILAVQLSVAWAGEARCQPRRLGWWQTDLVDEEGGGDLFRRLAPRTHRWAALTAVREAARRVDGAARALAADPDRLVSLFHLGPHLDVLLEDRLAFHRRDGKAPPDALPDLYPFARGVSAFASWLHPSDYAVEAAGRRLRGAPTDAPRALVDRLAGALAPVAGPWPFPHARLDA